MIITSVFLDGGNLYRYAGKLDYALLLETLREEHSIYKVVFYAHRLEKMAAGFLSSLEHLGMEVYEYDAFDFGFQVAKEIVKADRVIIGSSRRELIKTLLPLQNVKCFGVGCSSKLDLLDLDLKGMKHGLHTKVL